MFSYIKKKCCMIEQRCVQPWGIRGICTWCIKSGERYTSPSFKYAPEMPELEKVYFYPWWKKLSWRAQGPYAITNIYLVIIRCAALLQLEYFAPREEFFFRDCMINCMVKFWENINISSYSVRMTPFFIMDEIRRKKIDMPSLNIHIYKEMKRKSKKKITRP